MTRVKKTYCMVSLIVAMVVLVLTLSWSAGGTTVYAASMDPDSITTFDGDNSEGGVTRAAEDSTNGLTISYNNDGGSLSAPVKMLLVLTILSLAPSILIMLTSYTRIIIVLHFLRTAIGTQTAPPNQVLIALALFLTFFIIGRHSSRSIQRRSSLLTRVRSQRKRHLPSHRDRSGNSCTVRRRKKI